MEAGEAIDREAKEMEIAAVVEIAGARKPGPGRSPERDCHGSRRSQQDSDRGTEMAKAKERNIRTRRISPKWPRSIRIIHRRSHPPMAPTTLRPRAKPKLKRAEYEEELQKLQVELKLQEWVKATGAKVMVGSRDVTAGKGGVIKAIAERTSHRVFRVVALPHADGRVKRHRCTSSGTSRSAALRGWCFSTEAGTTGQCRARDGLRDAGAGRTIPGGCSGCRASCRAGIILVKYWLEVSAENQTESDSRAQGRVREDLEALAYGHAELHTLGRLHRSARRYVRGD